MSTYLVGNGDMPFEDRDFVFIEAKNEKEARYKFGNQIGARIPIFREHVYEKSANMSFAETFWFQTPQEELAFREKDTLPSKSTFKGRVRTFFKSEPRYADLYLDYYFGEGEYPDVQPFPEDMLLHIWLYLKDWTNLVIIDVNTIAKFQ